MKAFTAFQTYLEMGPQRSLAAVAARLGKSKVLMERWSRRHTWLERIAAHGAFQAQIERTMIESLARDKAVEWHRIWEDQRIAEWQARCDALRLAKKAIARWEANENKCGTLEGSARLLELMHKLGRSAAGMPTESPQVTEEVSTTLEIEWEVALKKVYGRNEAPEDAKVIEAVVVDGTNEQSTNSKGETI